LSCVLLEFIGEAVCSASSFHELNTLGFEFCSDSIVDFTVFDCGSSELDAITILGAMDGIGSIPSFGGSRFADMHVSPLMTIGGIIAFAIMNIDVMMFRSLSKVIDLLMVTSSIITHTIVAGVD